jgi:hypothetical protein
MSANYLVPTTVRRPLISLAESLGIRHSAPFDYRTAARTSWWFIQGIPTPRDVNQRSDRYTREFGSDRRILGGLTQFALCWRE